MTVDVELKVVDARAGTPIPWWGFAAVEWTSEKATVYIVRGWVTLERVGHELAHLQPLGSGHHPWWHFCLRTGHGLRRWKHAEAVTQKQVAEITGTRTLRL